MIIPAKVLTAPRYPTCTAPLARPGPMLSRLSDWDRLQLTPRRSQRSPESRAGAHSASHEKGLSGQSRAGPRSTTVCWVKAGPLANASRLDRTALRSIGNVRTALFGADDCLRHIEELRQAIDSRPPKKRTDWSEPVEPLGKAFGTESKELKFMALRPPLSPLLESTGPGCPT